MLFKCCHISNLSPSIYISFIVISASKSGLKMDAFVFFSWCLDAYNLCNVPGETRNRLLSNNQPKTILKVKTSYGHAIAL